MKTLLSSTAIGGGHSRFSLWNMANFSPDELNGIPSFGGGNDQGGQGGNAGGLGGFFDNGGGNDDGGGQQGALIGVDGGDEDDPDDFLSAFERDDDPGLEPDDTNPQQTQIGDVPAERIQGMQSQIQQMIQNMRIPDNMIPQDLDVSDRAQLHQVLNNTVQAAVSQSLNVVFKPVQLAMQHMAEQFQTQMDSKIREAQDSIQVKSILEQKVPEINDPKYSPLVRQLDSTLKNNGKKPSERADIIRKTLNRMGITSTANNGNQRRASGLSNGGNQPTGVRSGAAALDAFFGPMPTQNRNGNGGRR